MSVTRTERLEAYDGGGFDGYLWHPPEQSGSAVGLLQEIFYISRDLVAAVEDAVSGHPDIQLHVHENAGQAFDNHEANMFHNPKAAKDAWRTTTDFLSSRASLQR